MSCANFGWHMDRAVLLQQQQPGSPDHCLPKQKPGQT